MIPAVVDILPDFMPGTGAMLFNSFEYLLVFLPLVVLGYFGLNRHPESDLPGKLWLTLASLFFYGWWSIAYLWLIGGSMLFNYGMARWLGRLASRSSLAQGVLGAAIVGNLLLLGYYKYVDFFIANFNHWVAEPLPLLHLALPLGISFFTFTQIAFLVDVFRGKAREYNPVHYALFVTYFPHLIAGPILHHAEMMPQFASPTARRVNWQNIHLGLFIIAVGLIKKVVLADSLAVGADAGFNNPEPLPFHQAWITSLSYTLQLYFDFSGYTDMAIGASLLFNISLPANFNSPYKALDIRDFWRRWHMTLSRWLRDYLYFPLGGSRHGAMRTYAALLVTFLLGGLWHGAAWTFVAWGALHGLAAALHKVWLRLGWKLPVAVGWTLTFLFVNAAWVFFRSDSISQALSILRSMAGLQGFATLDALQALGSDLLSQEARDPFIDAAYAPARQLLVLAPCLLMVLLAPNTAQLAQRDSITQPGWCAAIIVGLIAGTGLGYTLFMKSGITTFIYFYF
jgi:alginate O-acetyltransferase complex protein AlgI